MSFTLTFDLTKHFTTIQQYSQRLFSGKGAYIFPAQCGVAVFTVYVSNSMQSCEQMPFLCRSTANIHSGKHIDVSNSDAFVFTLALAEGFFFFFYPQIACWKWI